MITNVLNYICIQNYLGKLPHNYIFELATDAVIELESNFVVSVSVKNNKLPQIRIFRFTEEVNAENLLDLREQNIPVLF